MMRRALAVVIASLLAAGCQQPAVKAAKASDTKPKPLANTQRVLGSYIVTLHADATHAAIEKAYGDLGVESIQPISQDHFEVRLARDPGPEEMVKRAKAAPGIKAVQPNYIYHLFRKPSLH